MVEYCEDKFPQTTQEFKKILDEMYEIFCKKQRNYGPGNISVGSTLETQEDKNLSLTGLWFRKNDKIQRLLQLVVRDNQMRLVRVIEDTYQDLSRLWCYITNCW